MSGRKRTVQIKFRVTEEERALIEQKMKLVPTRNMESLSAENGNRRVHHSDRPRRHKSHDSGDTENRCQHQPDSAARQCHGQRLSRGHRGNKGGACGDMAVTKIKPIKSTLNKALDYIQNPDKTDGKMLVSSFGCSPETADIEFDFTIAQALNRGNNLAHHLIQSFEPGEVDYEKAHEIGKQLADAVTKGQYEYVLTTHIDKGHVHNHIIFCAVNFVDHHKYNSNKRSYYGIRNMSDRLCRENGLSVVVPQKGGKGKSYAEYLAGENRNQLERQAENCRGRAYPAGIQF